jgi:CelD/BcsL family acetyltransferase involved in cellulose biosynthesis
MTGVRVTADVKIPLRLSVRYHTIARVTVRMHRVAVTLDGALAGDMIALPEIGDAAGWLVTSLPVGQVAALSGGGSIARVRQRYQRRYIELSGGFDAYLTKLSPSARASIQRKARRLAASGMRVTAHHDAASIGAFHATARMISMTTYQERRLNAGLPYDAAFVADMRRRAEAGRMRAWLLHVGATPAAYLYCPVEGDTLIYAYLGYDPAFARLSPGTVLQFEALRDLFAHGGFARFDFTEGDGQHKRQFATGSIDCADLLLLRPTIANRATAALIGGFDRLAEGAKRLGGAGLVRRLLR